MDNFVHLHRHSEFSLLDGVGTAEVYASRAAEIGQAALAITDHGNLAGALYHIEACEEHGIKPILGMESYFRQDIAVDRQNKDSQNVFHLVLLAKNAQGWQNLIRLSSIAYSEENFYGKPCIDWRLLSKYREGLIASTSCVSGIVPKALLEHDESAARKLLARFQQIFGDDLYLEIQPHDFRAQRIINLALVNLANELGMPIVATADVHFPFKDWHETQDILVKTKIGNENDLNVPETCWLSTSDEIYESFREYHPSIADDFIRDSVNNSCSISDRIEHFQIDKSPKIPKATRSALEAESILREWCQEGLERIGKTSDPIYLERLEEEFRVLRKLKVMDYFVIVGDMVRWAKNEGIRVGPGRGSAAGCLINYLIKITAIDPIGYDLLFERFMNEYRPELPDIDIDFQDDRRDEVKDYLRRKWGDDHVVDIAAFQSFGLKAAIKDVGRVLEIPYVKLHRATEAIPDKTWGMDLTDIENQLPAVKELFTEYPDLRTHALRLQGQIKNRSKHAAAVVVTDRPAQDVIPMMRSKDEGIITQWSERANGQLISPYGFLKIDCLATDGLTMQDRAIKMIEERHGIKIDFEDLRQFPMIESPNYAEQDVVEAFADGALIGVFQFQNSAGIKTFLKELQPDHLSQVIAANAMYRPGPMEFLDDFAARRHGADWELIHEELRPYFEKTYGILVFQEQVMQLYKALGKDVDPAESGIFLKVVSKGIARDLDGKKKIQKYYEKFAKGCAEKGIPKTAYDKVWDQILQMTTYAFNKSHSTGYAVQGYQDKWLKKRYPLEFYASLLTTKSDDAKKIGNIIKESRVFGVQILPPDVNVSGRDFTIDNNNIRFGLLAVKHVADAAADEIIRKRLYPSFEIFFERVQAKKVNKRVKRVLVESGAFDSLGGRSEWILDEDGNKVEGSLTIKQRSDLEKQILGYSLSRKSDIELYKKVIKERTVPSLVLDKYENQEVMLGGEIMNLKEYKTKNGDIMAFVDLSFQTDDYSLTLFPETYQKNQHMLAEGNAILVIGDWDKERGSTVVKNVCTAAQLAEDLKRG